jgi:hypothetical protein
MTSGAGTAFWALASDGLVLVVSAWLGLLVIRAVKDAMS